MYLLIDIGGTKTRVAFSQSGDQLDKIAHCETEQDLDAEIKQISKLAAEVTGLAEIKAAAIALPGILNQDHDMLLRSPNLTQWEKQPLIAKLQTATQAPVRLVNDAAAAGLGEAAFGAGLDYNIVAYLTLSTGIGGARITGRQIDSSHAGFEPGHSIIDIDGSHAPKAAAPSTLEDTIGGNSILRRLGQKSEDIKDPAFWEQFHHYLACGLNNVIAFWSPDAIILGGAQMNDVDISKLEEKLSQISFFALTLPAIYRTALGDKAGLMGTLSLVQN